MERTLHLQFQVQDSYTGSCWADSDTGLHSDKDYWHTHWCQTDMLVLRNQGDKHRWSRHTEEHTGRHYHTD